MMGTAPAAIGVHPGSGGPWGPGAGGNELRVVGGGGGVETGLVGSSKVMMRIGRIGSCRIGTEEGDDRALARAELGVEASRDGRRFGVHIEPATG